MLGLELDGPDKGDQITAAAGIIMISSVGVGGVAGGGYDARDAVSDDNSTLDGTDLLIW